MQLILEENGSFSSHCSTAAIPNKTTPAAACADQTALLVKNGLIIPVAQIVSPLLGLFVDKFGPKKAAIAQATCLMIGLALILLAVSNNTANTDPLLFVGFTFVAIHTWFGRLLIIQLGLYFTGHNISRVIFVLNSLFDAGAVTYLAIWGIKQAMGTSTLAILGGYTVLAGLVSMGNVYYWMIANPKDRPRAVDALESELDLSKHVIEDIMTEVDVDGRRESTFKNTEVEAFQYQHPTNNKSCGSYILIAERTRREQLTSVPFLLLCAIFGLNVMCNNWNIMTQRTFLAGLGDDDHDHLYLTLFVLMTPVSVLGAPLIDRVILRFGWMVGFQFINLLGFGYTLIKVASTNLNVQVLGFVLFSFYRSFLFGLSFSFLPTLVAGRLVGTAAGTLAGVAGCATLLTIPLVNLAVKRNDGDFFISNMIMLSLVCPAILLVGFLKQKMALEYYAKEAAKKDAEPMEVTNSSITGEIEC